MIFNGYNGNINTIHLAMMSHLVLSLANQMYTIIMLVINQVKWNTTNQLSSFMAIMLCSITPICLRMTIAAIC